MNDAQRPHGPAPAPWWKHGHVWLLIAGPATVVVAGVITTVLAVRGADPVVAHDYYRRGIEMNKTLAARDKALLLGQQGHKALLPAQQGRNHAVTPARP